MDARNETGGSDGPKATIAGLYNRVARLYGQVGPNVFAYAGQQLVDRAGIAEGAQVLDVGVGRGANLFPAAQKVGSRGQVIGIDLAEKMLQETAAEIAHRSLMQAAVLPMDAEQLSFPPASFDTVLCGFAILLFPHLEQALSEFYRVLRPSGKVGITLGHEPDALSQWYGKHLTDYSSQYHFPLNAGGTHLDYRSEMPLLLSRAGFNDVQILHDSTGVVYTDAQQWWDVKWTHGTRYSLEHMPPQVLEQFKTDVFVRLQAAQEPDGIHEELHFQFIFGTKSLR